MAFGFNPPDSIGGLAPPHAVVGLEAELPHARTRSLGLDVIRAVAILLVLAAHWAATILPWFGLPIWAPLNVAGNIGVELFFGLSGFLIGTILLKEGARDPSLRNLRTFLVRRWMRTLPLYYLVLIVLAALFPPATHLWGDLLKYATLTQNAVKPLPAEWWYPVSWSLAVEEWFYMLFGCAAFAAFRFLPARWAIWPPIAVFLIAPLCLRLAFPDRLALHGVWALVVALRLDDIAYGVIAAELYRRGSWMFRHPWICLAVGLIVVALIWSHHTPAPRTLAPVLVFDILAVGCVLLLPAALRLRTLPRWLEAAVKTVSAQSYGLYLIHMIPLTDIADRLWRHHLAPTWLCVAIAVITPFPLSYLSFRFFEAPILRRRPRHDRSAPGEMEARAPVAAPGTA